MDPFLDFIQLLKPQATLFGAGLEAHGRWALSFRQRDDLLFCWVETGECRLLRAGTPATRLRQGDFVLVHTSSPFALASDAATVPIDSETAVAAGKSHRLRLGKGNDRPVVIHAGKFVFNAGNEELLMGFLPPMVHLARDDASLGRIRPLLAMSEGEARSPGPGSRFVIVRLVELLLVEILRAQAWQTGQEKTGLLAGLSDPVTARALSFLHQDVARAWTVALLAKQCAVSRSTLAARFRLVVGTGPMEYLQRWRMALARDALRSGTRSVGDIALSIGFQSSSAFSTAFTRAVGCSPTRFAAG